MNIELLLFRIKNFSLDGLTIYAECPRKGFLNNLYFKKPKLYKSFFRKLVRESKREKASETTTSHDGMTTVTTLDENIIRTSPKQNDGGGGRIVPPS